VIIRTREHLAGVTVEDDATVLEIMHFGDELVNANELRFPKATQARPKEVDMAKKLIDGMTSKWNPDKYEDEYKTQLMEMIEEKIKHPREKHKAPKAPKKPSNVIDLMSVLQESLSATHGGNKKAKRGKTRTKTTKTRRRKAA
jgi:DNA end-binding protein Ku